MSDRPLLRRIEPTRITAARRPAVDTEIERDALAIVEHVRTGGEAAVRSYAERFGERPAGEPIMFDRAAMRTAAEALPRSDRDVLGRAAERIETFARAQRAAIHDVTIDVPGGRAGHTAVPVDAAGCYAPAGRYPLPSSVLMTAITARVAGCRRVVVASPGAHPVMLAAAHIAGADTFLAVGGAHAIAALAYGFEDFGRCDVIAGPGNAWVTAAKKIVSGIVGIDMLAGPSELLIVADEEADAALIAADLLAQAEHDADAVPMLITTSEALAGATDAALRAQLAVLSTRETAEAALANGFTGVVPAIDTAVTVADAVAAEHLEIMTRDPEAVGTRIRHAGAVFRGAASAEVVGDYGAGPNHTLPTGGTARFMAGLSVMNFLRLRTWIDVRDADAAADLLADTRDLARMEGLAGHAAAARARLVESAAR